ncbi:VanZ family protein [Marinomonas epiphytica]
MLQSIVLKLASFRLQFIGFILGGLIISWATLSPMEALPAAPGSDKLHHIIGFGGWALMCAFGPSRSFYFFACCIFLWGGAIELIQPNVNRYGEWLDFWADGLGVLLALLLHFFTLRVFSNQR